MVEEMKNGNENMNESVVAEQMHDTQMEKGVDMQDAAEVAEKVLKKAEGANLSDETKEKVKRVGFFAKLFGGKEKLTPEQKAAKFLEDDKNFNNLYQEFVNDGEGEMFMDRLTEYGEDFVKVTKNQNALNSWQDAEGKGRGIMFMDAVRDKGFPITWVEAEGRYVGSEYSSSR